MVIAMFLAHLVGDYVLQWDGLAHWKGRALKGVLVHGMVVALVNWAFSFPFDAGWWSWALLISLVHTAVDAVPLALKKRVPFHKTGKLALMRFLIDQAVHVGVILFVLVRSGYLALPSLATDLVAAFESDRLLAFILGYAFITMPAWILIEFMAYGLVNGSAPDFSQTTNKYVGILERGLITTFVMMGQFVLVPVVTLPRLIFEGRQVMDSQRATLYVAELLASVALAVAIGLGLRRL